MDKKVLGATVAIGLVLAATFHNAKSIAIADEYKRQRDVLIEESVKQNGIEATNKMLEKIGAHYELEGYKKGPDNKPVPKYTIVDSFSK